MCTIVDIFVLAVEQWEAQRETIAIEEIGRLGSVFVHSKFIGILGKQLIIFLLLPNFDSQCCVELYFGAVAGIRELELMKNLGA